MLSRNLVKDWLSAQMTGTLATLELPILRLNYKRVWQKGDSDTVKYWCDFMVASRETARVKAGRASTGIAFARLLPQLGIELDDTLQQRVKQTQLMAFALAAVHWHIDSEKLCCAYVLGLVRKIR